MQPLDAIMFLSVHLEGTVVNSIFVGVKSFMLSLCYMTFIQLPKYLDGIDTMYI